MLTLTKNRSLVVFFLFITIASSGCEEDNDTPATSSDDESLIDPAIQPRIISTYPPANGVGPFRVYNQGDGSSLPHFVVQFNKLMDRDLVRAGIAVSGFDRPARLTATVIGGSTRYSDVFSVVVNDSFFSRMPYAIGGHYTFSFDSSIVDINGNKLNQSSQSFLPEPFFRVVSVTPPSQETGVPVLSPIRLTFNSPVNSQILQSVSISPAATFLWSVGGSVVLFAPSGYLLLETTYNLSVSTTARDTLGNALMTPFTSTFTTTGFAVERVIPQGSTYPGGYVMVTFSGPIDTSTIRSNLTVIPEIPGRIGFNFANSREVYFTPTQDFLSGLSYQVILGRGIRSSEGDSLPAAYSWSFHVEQFGINSTTPHQNQSFVSRNSSITLFFNGRLDTSSVASQISSTPPIPGIFQMGSSGISGVTLVPSDSLLPSQGYSVRVSTGVRSLTGDSLEYPYFLYFSTGN